MRPTWLDFVHPHHQTRSPPPPFFSTWFGFTDWSMIKRLNRNWFFKSFLFRCCLVESTMIVWGNWIDLWNILCFRNMSCLWNQLFVFESEWVLWFLWSSMLFDEIYHDGVGYLKCFMNQSWFWSSSSWNRTVFWFMWSSLLFDAIYQDGVGYFKRFMKYAMILKLMTIACINVHRIMVNSHPSR